MTKTFIDSSIINTEKGQDASIINVGESYFGIIDSNSNEFATAWNYKIEDDGQIVEPAIKELEYYNFFLTSYPSTCLVSGNVYVSFLAGGYGNCLLLTTLRIY